jgi:superfamily II DNA or RNA helicase
MPEMMSIDYKKTGDSVKSNAMGMREMQEKVYEQRKAQYLLLKAPPASGKSRALMFIALDKIYNQGLKKTIVAVPERSIGSSFAPTNLSEYGFFTDWKPENEYNLCYSGSDSSTGKIKKFHSFLKDENAKVIICTHATLRYAFKGLDPSEFNNIFLAIDEFHHVSVNEDENVLGDMMSSIIKDSSANVMAMTGSYFRGDGIPILTPETESLFTKVTYSYFDQLNGYKYLKTLNLNYSFYQGVYTDSIKAVLNPKLKTIIHIPNVNSTDSTKDKYNEIGLITDILGEVKSCDPITGLDIVVTEDGTELKVMDLVDETDRDKKLQYIREHHDKDDLDIIIALNLAKEGFDWPACEHTLTVGYRGSLTEIVQIIGRCTRDFPGKEVAIFTNLIAEPDTTSKKVADATNDMLKAITASLLMEQVMQPKWDYKSKKFGDGGDVKVDIKDPPTKRVRDIIENDLSDISASILNNPDVKIAMTDKENGKYINKVLVPKIIQETYPDLKPEELKSVRENVVTSLALAGKKTEPHNDIRYIKFADRLIDVKELDINLIDTINPFYESYEILSKNVDSDVLGIIQRTIREHKSSITLEDIKNEWHLVKEFHIENNRPPKFNSKNLYETHLAEILLKAQEIKRKQVK